MSSDNEQDRLLERSSLCPTSGVGDVLYDVSPDVVGDDVSSTDGDRESFPSESSCVNMDPSTNELIDISMSNVSGSQFLADHDGASSDKLIDIPIGHVSSSNLEINDHHSHVADVPTNPGRCSEVNLCSSRMTVPVIVGTECFHGVLDTGSSDSLISSSMVRKYSLPVRSIDDALNTFTGKQLSVSQVALLEFQIGSINYSSEFSVVNGDTLMCDLLLGEDFMKSNGVSLDAGLSRIIAQPSANIHYEFYIEQLTVRTVIKQIPLYCSQDVVISNGETVSVNVCLDPIYAVQLNDSFLFDGILEVPYLSGTMGVLYPGQNGLQVLIRKVEGYHSVERVRTGTRLCSVAEVVEVSVPEVNFVHKAEDDSEDFLSKLVDLSHLDSQRQSQVMAALKRSSAAFSRHESDIGLAAVTEHRIILDDYTPIRIKPRSFPEPVANEIEEQCEQLRQLDILDFTESSYSAPVMPIRKKDGSIRLCIDYRALNKVTKADRFPLPNMSDLVFGMHGMSWFTTLDLVKGYHQIPLHKDSMQYTAFSTSRNHYHYKRLPFGLKNAPSAFQREMMAILQSFNNKQVAVYLDDIIIMSRNFEEHLDLVSKVMKVLSEHGVKINAKKCQWFRREVVFLGHIVGEGGVRKSDEYTEAVRNHKKPLTVKELRSFLGVINYQRKFIPNCSDLCKELNQWLGQPDKATFVLYFLKGYIDYLQCQEEVTPWSIVY